jgi:hypothetical protein
MSPKPISLACLLACFLTILVAPNLCAEEQTPDALLQILLWPDTPDGLWQSTSGDFQKLPPEMAIRALFPEIAKGIPGGLPYAAYNCYSPEKDRHIGGWGRYCVSNWLWCKALICGRNNPQVGKTLLELLGHPQSLYGQTALLSALDSYSWVPEAEEPVHNLFKGSETALPVRVLAAACLLHHFEAKYHSEAVQFALYGPEKVRAPLFHELTSPHTRAMRIDPIVVRMGFALLFAELAKSEEACARAGFPVSQYGAFLYANNLGGYLGQKFAPDCKLPQYQGESGKEIWYRETVENALAWWSKSRE